MWKGKFKKWAAAVLAAAVLGAGIPAVEASAAGGYSQVDMFAQSTSIKGLQGALGDEFGGVQHTLQNVYIDNCIFAPGGWAVDDHYIDPYVYNGKTYYFSLGSLESIFDNKPNIWNMSVSVVFLLRWNQNEIFVGQSGDLSFLIDENSRVPGKNYYAPATTGVGGETFEAFWHFFMEECIRRNWRVDNFILGNEVNAPNSWHYSGNQDAQTVANKYADAFYTMWRAVRDYTDVSRCSISLDHSWQNVDGYTGSISARNFLEMFASRLAGHGDVDWCVSTHLYPAQLYDTRIWLDSEGLTANDNSARIVDGSNLWVMTNYIKETYGEKHRVMLTEQGFCNRYGSDAQAASLAYTYYAAKYDPMVDCFILNNEYIDDARNFDIRGTSAGEIYTRIDDEGFQQEIANRCLPVIGVSSWEQIIPNFGQEMDKLKPVEPPVLEFVQNFITRLYNVCLDRTPDEVGLGYWTDILMNRRQTGSQVAYGFVFSDEFRNMNLCNEHYVTYLYNAMMDREPDASGLTYWLEQFENGQTREEVFNGFVVSDEFTKICADYGVQRGNGVTVPQYGTVPTGACSVCGRPDGVTSFVKRLYSLCLDRDAEPDGLAYWCDQLWNHANSGRGVAYGFVSSQEFTEKGLSDEQFVEYMYRVFFDREFDSVGKGYWMNNMGNGWSREQVFDGFVDSEEFDSICRRYGIARE